MSSFIIKLIAIITMTIDHYNDVMIGHFTFLQIIGRIAFPLFCFQLVVGYSKTGNLFKYFIRMILFAMISQIPYIMFLKTVNLNFSLNVMFSLSIGLVTMFLYDLQIENSNEKLYLVLRDSKKKIFDGISKSTFSIINTYAYVIKMIFIFIICILTYFMKTEYDAWGIVLILFINMFYPFDGKVNILGKRFEIGRFANILIFLTGMFILSFVKYIQYWNLHSTINIIWLTIFTFATSIVMISYNGKKGPGLKYFFYIYYPAQFIILVLLKHLI